MTDRDFDVFLAHRKVDKPIIRKIYQELKERGLAPWLDEEEIPPGAAFQEALQQAIGQVKTAAICIGSDELSNWQALELKISITQCVKRKIPIIPVLLPGVSAIPESLLFLSEFHAVSFQNGIEDERALSRLEWGITGRRPKPKPLSPSNGNPAPDIVVKPIIDSLYTNLERYLKIEDWEKADDETHQLMIVEAGKVEEPFFTAEELKNFPCEALKVIDGLWVKHSNSRFGFSVQKEMYRECGGVLDGCHNREAFTKLCEENGWKVKDKWVNVISDNSSLKGHFPRFGLYIGRDMPGRRRGLRSTRFSALAFRLESCNL